MKRIYEDENITIDFIEDENAYKLSLFQDNHFKDEVKINIVNNQFEIF